MAFLPKVPKVAPKAQWQGPKNVAMLSAHGAAQAPTAPLAPKQLAPVDALLGMDFSLVLKDISDTRILLTDGARPKDVRALTAETARLFALVNEYQQKGGAESLQAPQIESEIGRIFKGITSLQKRGVLLSKDGAAVDLVGPPTAELPGAKRAPKAHSLAQTVAVGVDPATGAQVALQPLGRVIENLPLREFAARRGDALAREAAVPKLAADEVSLRALRSLTDEQLSAHGLTRAQGAEYVTLEGRSPEDQLLSFPTRWFREPAGHGPARRIVVEGPFRGIFLDDVVARLDAQSLQERLQASNLMWVKPSKASLEPVVTVMEVQKQGQTSQKLRIRVPSTKEWTSQRRSMGRLAEQLGGVTKVRDSKGTLFVFEAENFPFVQAVAQSFAVSRQAQGIIERNAAQLLEFDKALRPEALKAFSAKALGGFRPQFVDGTGAAHAFDLSRYQKEALAQLKFDDWRGPVTLGMGLGKTVVALTAMKEVAKAGEKRPFLAVVPKGNEGTFSAEIHARFLPDQASALENQLRVMNYEQFRKAQRTGKLADAPFNADQFGMVVFDEVHYATDRRTASGAAVLKFGHPRTIEMTGTPQPDPQRLQTMLAGTKGLDLNSPAARQDRLMARRWRKLLYEEVNGIAIGLKGPTELRPGLTVDFSRQLRAWIRRNFMFAEPGAGLKLPAKMRVQETIAMSPELEAAYRKAAKPAKGALDAAVSIYRDQGKNADGKRAPQARSPEVHELQRNLKPTIRELATLTNTAEKAKRAGKLLLERMVAEERLNAPLSRAILFSDDAAYVLKSAEEMSNQIPGKLHAACLPDRIEVFQNGKRLSRLGPFELPFREGTFRPDPTKPPGPSNREIPSAQWRTFVLGEVLGKHGEVATATMYGPTYQAGQNLQWANVVVHLDRDGWSELNMRQREARVWRQGQTKEVTIVNVDYNFSSPKSPYDVPLDGVRQYYQATEGHLLDATFPPSRQLKLAEGHSPGRSADSFDPTVWHELSQMAAGAEPTPRLIGLARESP